MYVTGNETLYPFHGNNNQELTASPQETVHLPASSNPESTDVAGNEPLYAFNGNFVQELPTTSQGESTSTNSPYMEVVGNETLDLFHGNFFFEEMELRSQEATSASAATNSESINISGNYDLDLLRGKNNRELLSFSQKNPDKPVASAGINVMGRRLVDFSFFIQNLKRFEDHGPFDCKIKDAIIVSEMKNGLNSSFRFKCRLCNFEDVVHTNEESVSINTAAVLGITAIGCGFSNMEELFSNLNVPCMSSRRFAKEQEHLTKAWEETATSEMAKAAEEEKRLARQREDVDSDGIPLLTVIVDGTWGKRSYRTNYSSLSGAAAIIGYHTEKVLYLGLRNKYCSMCARGKENKQHACSKNWSGPSSAMESDIIVNGFLNSMDMYGVKYSKMIGDGDSNVHKKILDSLPYGNFMVEKIECKNHLIRNVCSKLTELSKSTKNGFKIKFRKLLGANLFRMRQAIWSASNHHRKSEISEIRKMKELRTDLINIPYHIFGKHDKCSE
ncbi:uncharacterized protein, partial [Parasteatoda tepidariorum]|uniref:uncharacterized protein n=1 Tax=Parasteatoda tepidariorum TaxID=114398 RepID=UPI001C71F0BD